MFKDDKRFLGACVEVWTYVYLLHLFDAGGGVGGARGAWLLMDERDGEREWKRDDGGGIERVNRALCGAWYGYVTPGLGVVSAMRLWQLQFAVCLDSEAPP